MTEHLRTDFEEYDLSRGPYSVSSRLLLLTVDFEAFTPEMMPLWQEAMHHWAARASESRLRFCFFLSVENAIRLRVASQRAYAEFLKAMKGLEDVASLIYPHNHYVFDRQTGEKKVLAEEPKDLPQDYPKRKSVFYDTVHRHRLDLAFWLTTVRESYEEVLAAADCRRPKVPVFRAGGWDYGGSCRDVRQYIDAVVAAGFRADSSACRGAFGTPTWRIGSHFGSNVFWLDKGLLEIAPTWSMDISVSPLSLACARSLLSLRRQSKLWMGHRGAFVVVLHFDHLFRRWSRGSLQNSPLRDVGTLRKRIDRLFRSIALLRSILCLHCATFEDIELGRSEARVSA
jgi:hypothetical protein